MFVEAFHQLLKIIVNLSNKQNKSVGIIILVPFCIAHVMIYEQMIKV